MKVFLSLLTLFIYSAHAADIQLSVFEQLTKETTYYSFNLETGKVKEIHSFEGTSISAEGPFEIRNRKLFLENVELTAADEILSKAKIDNTWVLVVTSEYNSYSNPLRWFAASIGHPVQVTRVIVLSIRDGKMIYEKEITKEPSSYHWQAAIFEFDSK